MTQKDNLTKNIREVLNDQNDKLDGATLSRLNQARQRALERSATKKRTITGWSLTTATCAVILITTLFRLNMPTYPIYAETDDWQIITGEESLEFFQEDIAFYEWVSEVMDEEGGNSVDTHHLSGDSTLLSGPCKQGHKGDKTTGRGASKS